MFSQLSGWIQYLYVILFMMICGYGVPYFGGLNIFVLSLAAGSGALVLTKNTWLDGMLAHHQTISFFAPLILLIVFAITYQFLMSFVHEICLAFDISTSPDGFPGKFLTSVSAIVFLVVMLLPAYVPFHVIGVKGWLLFAAAAAFVVGAIISVALLISSGESMPRQYILQWLSCLVLSAGLYFMITKPAPSGLIWLGGSLIIALSMIIYGLTEPF